MRLEEYHSLPEEGQQEVLFSKLREVLEDEILVSEIGNALIRSIDGLPDSGTLTQRQADALQLIANQTLESALKRGLAPDDYMNVIKGADRRHTGKQSYLE